MIEDIKQWLNSEPDESEIAIAPNGGYHIPIERLRDLLDEVKFSTRNYKWHLYMEGREQCAAASIELEIEFEEYDRRTFTGACNIRLKDYSDWNASAKSLCEKNAAIEAAKRFGRHLNDGLEIVPPPSEETPENKVKRIIDPRIKKQLELAILNGDTATQTILENMYEIGRTNE